jgi:hypothetical protein
MRRAFSAINGYQYEDAYKEQVKPPHSMGFLIQPAQQSVHLFSYCAEGASHNGDAI